MKNFALYKIATGVIVQMCKHPSKDAVLDICGPDENVVEVPDEVNDTAYYIAAGYAVPYPPRPNFSVVWSGTEWFDPRELQELKRAAMERFKVKRDRVVFGGVEWNGWVFDSDQRSQSVMLGAYVDSQQPNFSPVPWRLADNSWQVLSAADFAALWSALRAHITNAFTAFAIMEAQVEAAENAAQLEALLTGV